MLAWMVLTSTMTIKLPTDMLVSDLSVYHSTFGRVCRRRERRESLLYIALFLTATIQLLTQYHNIILNENLLLYKCIRFIICMLSMLNHQV